MLYTVVQTRRGWLGIAGPKDGSVSMLTLPVRKMEWVVGDLAAEGMPPDAVESVHGFSGVAEQVKAYFAGKRVEFDCELDLGRHGAFDRAVWDAARNIPYSELRTYKWVAGEIGRPGAARAVGQALGRNPVPLIIPCHRVIKSDGTLGGFGSGLGMKSLLLRIESGIG